MNTIANRKGKLRFQNRIQLMVVDFDGIIKETDHTLFNWKEENSIFEVHPFFEIINSLLENPDHPNQDYTFPCVHLDCGNNIKICDVTISFDLTEVIIVIFEYTSKYMELLEIAQQRNETFIKNQNLQLQNKLLLNKEEFKNSLISNINHNIKTPLTGILGFTEILEKTSLSFEQEDLIRIIKRETKHLDTIVSDMLDISKIESGQLKVNYENFDFQKLVESVNNKYSYIAKEKNIIFEVSMDAAIQEELLGDQNKVWQILLNILSNAFRFTSKGKISLHITKNYQKGNKISVNFSVTDSGSGISEENLEYIFDRFTRFNQDKEVSGTGLSLAIVKNLVDLIGGDIKVLSELGKGSVFSFNLPFKLNLISNKNVTKPQKQYQLPKLNKKFKVLLVEDKEVNQYLVMKILISHGRFFVDVASNGEEAIKYIEKKEYDVVIMDLMMSPIDGYEATRMIRKNYGDDQISKVPIIGFTANNIKGEREKCLKSGMNDFITKPFGREDLIYKVIKQISKKYTN